MDLNYIAAGLSICLAGLGVAAGQGYLVYKTMNTIGKNPRMTGFFLTATILGIALIESSAIYALLISVQLFDASFIDPLAALGAGLAIGLAGLGVGIGQGILLAKGIHAINLNPDYKNKILAYIVLYVALIESSAIYGLIIALQIFLNSNIGGFESIGAALAIGITALGVGLGESFIAQKAILSIGDEPKRAKILLPFSVLAIALVETSAIYGFIVATQVLGSGVGIAALGAGLAIGLAGLGVSLGESVILERVIDALEDVPEKIKSLIPMAILSVALVESAAIYALLIALNLSTNTEIGVAGIGAGLAIGLAGLGVSLGEGFFCRKAMESTKIYRVNMSRLITFMILFVALIESGAIYGLLISFQIIGGSFEYPLATIGVALAIGLAAMGVGIGEGILSAKSIDISSRRPQYANYFMTITVLGIALVESAAIYGLIIAMQMIQTVSLLPALAIGAGLAIGGTALGVGLFEGVLVSGAFHAISRNPNNRTKDITLMILFIALVESVAIYGLYIASTILK